MSGLHLRTILHHLWSSAGSPKGGSLADAELLRRWVATRDPAAFEVLLWRHGPMILELCRRLLRREQDAEDVFQSAFHALALKGNAISKGEAVGSWLYTVSYRAALQVRNPAGRPETIDPHLLDRRAAPPGEEIGSRELRLALDEEVRRLPEKYRGAFILCYLEGLTNEEAAQRLGRPVGTVVSRLARARQWLRRRLTGRGLAPAVVVTLLSARAIRAGLPPRLAEEITRAAAAVAAGKAAGAVSPAVAALTEGVLRTMCKAKMTTVVLIVLGVATLGVLGTSLSFVRENERQATTAAWYQAGAAYGGQPGGPGFAPTRPSTPASSPAGMGSGGPGLGPTQMGAPGPSSGGGPRPSHPPEEMSAPEKAAHIMAMREQLRDEIETLEAQLAVKRAQLEAATVAATGAKVQAKNMQQRFLERVVDGSVAQQAKLAATLAEAEIKVREAELREPMVRLTQARRRLAGLERAAAPNAGPPHMRERLHGLEQKLEALRKEVEAMRKELGEGKPGKP